jgi:hypothetical protein
VPIPGPLQTQQIRPRHADSSVDEKQEIPYSEAAWRQLIIAASAHRLYPATDAAGRMDCSCREINDPFVHAELMAA